MPKELPTMMTTAMTTPARRSGDGLTRDNAMLLLVDHQVGLLWEPEAAELRRTVEGLARAARILGVPTVLAAAAPDQRGPIVPELTAAVRDAPVIERTTGNAWDDSRVRLAVQATRRDRLIIAGVTTDACVAPAALASAAAGYAVYVAADASAHFDQRAAAAAMVRMRRAGVVVTSAATMLLDMVMGAAAPNAVDVVTLVLRSPLPAPVIGIPSVASLSGNPPTRLRVG